jgi:predicted nucleic acid-binding protein
VTVLVDTTIWSLALRRRGNDLNPEEQHLLQEWGSLVASGQVALVGPIRQEILSGIRRESDFVAMQRQLSAFGYLEVVAGDYDRAAVFFNVCRSNGVSGTPIDLLICAVAERLDLPIFTTDADFALFAKYLPIRLHVRRKRGI